MSRPTIFGDFNGIQGGPHGLSQIGLDYVGSISDLAEKGVQLREGMPLTLSDYDELEVDARAHFDESQGSWVARFDWAAIRTIPRAEAELSPAVASTENGASPPVSKERNVG
jgi:hypothetical protein